MKKLPLFLALILTFAACSGTPGASQDPMNDGGTEAASNCDVPDGQAIACMVDYNTGEGKCTTHDPGALKSRACSFECCL